MIVTAYKTSTGEITRTINCPEAFVNDNLEKGEAYINGEYEADEYYISSGKPTIKKAKPPTSVYDYSAKAWVQDIEQIKKSKLDEIRTKYLKVCQGKDPSTGKDIYVDCVVGQTTYRMNAGKDAAAKMDGGVRIFERMGAATMPVVRDFNNVNHTDVPLADAISISLQQGANALAHWQQKGAFVDAINAAATVAEVQAINITFSVKA